MVDVNSRKCEETSNLAIFPIYTGTLERWKWQHPITFFLTVFGHVGGKKLGVYKFYNIWLRQTTASEKMSNLLIFLFIKGHNSRTVKVTPNKIQTGSVFGGINI